MPRAARLTPGNVVYHVLNRGNGRATVFHKPADFAAFEKLLEQAAARVPVRIAGYCLMPNHFWPALGNLIQLE
jgi:putative transposase